MFDKDFVWGVAGSAYQVEGTDPEDGRENACGIPLRRQAEYLRARQPTFPATICTVTEKIML